MAVAVVEIVGVTGTVGAMTAAMIGEMIVGTTGEMIGMEGAVTATVTTDEMIAARARVVERVTGLEETPAETTSAMAATAT